MDNVYSVIVPLIHKPAVAYVPYNSSGRQLNYTHI